MKGRKTRIGREDADFAETPIVRSYSNSEEAKIYHNLDLKIQHALNKVVDVAVVVFLQNGTIPKQYKQCQNLLHPELESEDDSNQTVVPAYMKVYAKSVCLPSSDP
eukprot:766143-Hanusia_phi.AAC.1